VAIDSNISAVTSVGTEPTAPHAAPRERARRGESRPRRPSRWGFDSDTMFEASGSLSRFTAVRGARRPYVRVCKSPRRNIMKQFDGVKANRFGAQSRIANSSVIPVKEVGGKSCAGFIPMGLARDAKITFSSAEWMDIRPHHRPERTVLSVPASSVRDLSRQWTDRLASYRRHRNDEHIEALVDEAVRY